MPIPRIRQLAFQQPRQYGGLTSLISPFVRPPSIEENPYYGTAPSDLPYDLPMSVTQPQNLYTGDTPNFWQRLVGYPDLAGFLNTRNRMKMAEQDAIRDRMVAVEEARRQSAIQELKQKADIEKQAEEAKYQAGITRGASRLGARKEFEQYGETAPLSVQELANQARFGTEYSKEGLSLAEKKAAEDALAQEIATQALSTRRAYPTTFENEMIAKAGLAPLEYQGKALANAAAEAKLPTEGFMSVGSGRINPLTGRQFTEMKEQEAKTVFDPVTKKMITTPAAPPKIVSVGPSGRPMGFGPIPVGNETVTTGSSNVTPPVSVQVNGVPPTRPDLGSNPYTQPTSAPPSVATKPSFLAPGYVAPGTTPTTVPGWTPVVQPPNYQNELYSPMNTTGTSILDILRRLRTPRLQP